MVGLSVDAIKPGKFFFFCFVFLLPGLGIEYRYSSCVVVTLSLGLFVAVPLKELWLRLMLQP